MKTDPQFSYLLAMFQKLCYEISSSESGHEFDKFMSKQVAACKIQTAYRGYYTRKIMRGKSSVNEIMESLHLMRKCGNSFDAQNVFQGMTFVFVGVVPKQNGQKYTHHSLETRSEEVWWESQ